MSKSTLMVVDDSRFLHKLVRAQLEDEPVLVHSVYDGESALSEAVAHRPNLILLDVDMPQLDGFEVCRRLKSNPATGSTPIIFLTADASLSDKVKGLDLGASDYITKPFKPEELRARVRSALRAKHQLDKTSMVDGRTGLWNRAYLDLHLGCELSLAERSGRPLACVTADIDSLGKINGEFGQGIGDEVLRAVAHIFLSHCRAEDSVCHSENGKFIALISSTNSAGAAHLADRIRAEVERQLLRCGGIKVGATCSFGVADTQDGNDGSLLDRAEAALYKAKQIGPNTVSVNRPTASEVCATN